MSAERKDVIGQLSRPDRRGKGLEGRLIGSTSVHGHQRGYNVSTIELPDGRGFETIVFPFNVSLREIKVVTQTEPDARGVHRFAVELTARILQHSRNRQV